MEPRELERRDRDGGRFERRLSRGADSAAEARGALDALADRLPADQLGDVRLLVSELVSNAIHHAELGAQDAICLAVALSHTVIRVEVHDPGTGFAVGEIPRHPERSSGWGLFLVETLADRWGVERLDGTSVWFELDRDDAAAG